MSASNHLRDVMQFRVSAQESAHRLWSSRLRSTWHKVPEYWSTLVDCDSCQHHNTGRHVHDTGSRCSTTLQVSLFRTWFSTWDLFHISLKSYSTYPRQKWSNDREEWRRQRKQRLCVQHVLHEHNLKSSVSLLKRSSVNWILGFVSARPNDVNVFCAKLRCNIL